mmetsp:Transcript_30504/g.35981  ORF Transcript_30504/g.35981 Transcript_30504/m.35981 type:complete len:206 (-) Transcript_30504:1872-2489(-)
MPPPPKAISHPIVLLALISSDRPPKYQAWFESKFCNHCANAKGENIVSSSPTIYHFLAGKWPSKIKCIMAPLCRPRPLRPCFIQGRFAKFGGTTQDSRPSGTRFFNTLGGMNLSVDRHPLEPGTHQYLKSLSRLWAVELEVKIPKTISFWRDFRSSRSQSAQLADMLVAISSESGKLVETFPVINDEDGVGGNTVMAEVSSEDSD